MKMARILGWRWQRSLPAGVGPRVRRHYRLTRFGDFFLSGRQRHAAASSKVTVTLPTGTPSSTVVVAQASSAPAWLVVTPASGYSPWL